MKDNKAAAEPVQENSPDEPHSAQSAAITPSALPEGTATLTRSQAPPPKTSEGCCGLFQPAKKGIPRRLHFHG